jgi:hypothetical protein
MRWHHTRGQASRLRDLCLGETTATPQGDGRQLRTALD